MTTYVRRQTPVEVFHYDNQPRDAWPEWLEKHSCYNQTTGVASVAVDITGALLIPTQATFLTAHRGDYVVREGSVVTVHRPGVFHSLYEEVQAVTENQAEASAERPAES